MAQERSYDAIALDGSFHQALQPPINLDVAIASVKAGTPPLQHSATETVQVEEEKDQFKAAILEYENTAEPKYRTSVDPDNTHSIEQLWQVIDDQMETYQTKDKKGVWGKVRLTFRKLGDGSETAQGWLGQLPTESVYMSVAAARMRDVAEKALDALCQIPLILSGTRRVLSIFKKSQELQKCSRAFFETGLVEKIDDITKRRDAFNEKAEMCHKEVVHRLKEASEKSGNGIKDEMRAISMINAAPSPTGCIWTFQQLMKLLNANPMAEDYVLTTRTHRMKKPPNSEFNAALPR
ncbi:hypothetical protein B0T22DRAFT_481554 [Podospora appendiculata]|uniref:Uncharacterized protein n=1 Tax=Podospora appendiculata TaxID=314037 RepID=A0AAE1CEB5_9PEZI|nr:hypothetical protein B0T22DRAFT_481554 [Podospora appendiculata]